MREREQETVRNRSALVDWPERRGARRRAAEEEEVAADVGRETLSSPADFEQSLTRLPQR